MKQKQITAKIPLGFINVTVTSNNNLVADTNDSTCTYWDSVTIPLPAGNWKVLSVIDRSVTLVEDQHVS